MSGKRIDENWLENRFRNANQSSEYVQTLSLWALHHKNQCDQITEVWYRVFQTVPEEQQIALLYLCNDILQTCKRRNAHAFKDTFKQVLASAISLIKEEKGKMSVGRILQVWMERQVYEQDYVQALNQVLNPEEKRAAEREPVVLDLEDFDLKEVTKRITKDSEGWMGDERQDGLKEQLDEYGNALADVALYTKSSIETKRNYIESNKQTINNTCKLYVQLEKFLNEKNFLLSHLELTQKHYHTVGKESKLIAMAYRNYKSRVENLRSKLHHRRNILMLAEQAKMDGDDDDSDDDDGGDDDDVVRNSAFEDKLNNFYINNFTNNKKNVDLDDDVRPDDGLLNELYPSDVTTSVTNQESSSSIRQNPYQQQENTYHHSQQPPYHHQQHNLYQQQQHGYYPQQVAPEQQVILIEPQQDHLQQQQQIISPQPQLISPQHLLSPQQQLLIQQQSAEFPQDSLQQQSLQQQQQLHLQHGQVMIQPQPHVTDLQHTTALKAPVSTTALSVPMTTTHVNQPNTHAVEPTTPTQPIAHPLATTQQPLQKGLIPNTDTIQDATPPPAAQSPISLTSQSPSSSPPPPPPPKDDEEEDEDGGGGDEGAGVEARESVSKGKITEKKAKKKKKKHKKKRTSEVDDTGDSDEGWRRRRKKRRAGKGSGEDEDEKEEEEDEGKESAKVKRKKNKKRKKSESVSKNRHRSAEKHTNTPKHPSNVTNNYQEIVYVYGEDEDGWMRIEAMGEKTLAETVGCHVKILARNEVDQVLRWCCLQSTQQQQLGYQQQQLVGQQLIGHHLSQQQILTQHPPPQLQQHVHQQQQPAPQTQAIQQQQIPTQQQQPPTHQQISQHQSSLASSSYPGSKHLPSPSQFCYGMGNTVLTQRQKEEASLADKNRPHYSTNRRTTTLKTIQLTDETPAVGCVANTPVAETITVTTTAVTSSAVTNYDVLSDSKNRTPKSGDDDDLSDSSAELLQGTQTFTTPLGVSPNSHVITHQAPPPMITNLSIKPPMIVTRPPAYLLQPPPNITRVVPNLQQPPPMFSLPPPHNPFIPQAAFVRPPQQFTHPF